MSEGDDQLIDAPVVPDGAGNGPQSDVGGVVADEPAGVEVGDVAASAGAHGGGHMEHGRVVGHRAHRGLQVQVHELTVRVGHPATFHGRVVNHEDLLGTGLQYLAGVSARYRSPREQDSQARCQKENGGPQPNWTPSDQDRTTRDA